jgi:integrase
MEGESQEGLKLASPFAEPPTPHRFRHTFVGILLEKGVPETEVATLIVTACAPNVSL